MASNSSGTLAKKRSSQVAGLKPTGSSTAAKTSTKQSANSRVSAAKKSAGGSKNALSSVKPTSTITGKPTSKSTSKTSSPTSDLQQRHSFRAILHSSDNKLWGAHFVVPPDVAAYYQKDSAKRAVCTLNGSERYQCGILRGVKSQYVITVNATIRKKLKVVFGDTLQVDLEPDTSEYGLPLTEELKVALELDPDASELFHALTPGKQRTLLYIAANVKNPNLRAQRAIVILEHLCQQRGAIDFKLLNASIKEIVR